MSLGPADIARLNRIISLARKIELAWPSTDRQDSQNLADKHPYQELKREIAACREAESESLRRLDKIAAHLHDEVSLHHFYGCIVPFERLAGRSVRDDEFLVDEGDKANTSNERLPIKVIVENVRSSFNVGAIFRTSECLSASEIILCGYTPGPDDEKTSRTAMGTSSFVPWRRMDRAANACKELRNQGYKIIALETALNAESLHEMEFHHEPVAFILGNERFGIEAETLKLADAICRIPVRGMKNSMNVGVAFGVASFEWLRQFESIHQ